MTLDYTIGACSPLALDRLSRLRPHPSREVLRRPVHDRHRLAANHRLLRRDRRRHEAARRLHVPRVRGRRASRCRASSAASSGSLYRLSGVDPKQEQTWKEYTFALLAFSAIGVVVTYLFQRLQHVPAVQPAALRRRRAGLGVQHGGELHDEHELAGVLGRVDDELPHADGGPRLAQLHVGGRRHLRRARARPRLHAPARARREQDARQLLGRSHRAASSTCSCRSASSSALVLVWQGCIQNFSPYLDVTTLEGGKQTLALGPVASQEAIKQLGTNGGGFFNANSAHPFENPNPFTNFLSMFMIFAVSSALTYTYGRMARDQRHGWAVWGAMAILFAAGVAVCYPAEAHGNPALAGLAVDQTAGNMEGKEARFGVAGLGALRRRDDRRLVRRRQLDARQLHAARRPRAARQHPARRGRVRRHGRGPLRRCSSTSSSRCSSPASWWDARPSTSARRSRGAR